MYNTLSFPILKIFGQVWRNTAQLPLWLIYSTRRGNIQGCNVYVVLNLFFTFSGFGEVLLSGVRALSEQRSIVADYSSFK